MPGFSLKRSPIQIVVGLLGLHHGIYAATAGAHDSVLEHDIQSNAETAGVGHDTLRTLLNAADDYTTGGVGDDYVEEEGGAFAGAGADYTTPGDAAATPGALPDLEPTAVDDYGTDTDTGPTPAPTPTATPPTAEPAAVTPAVSPAEPTAVDPVAEPIGAEPTVAPEAVAPLVDEPTGGPEAAALEPESTVAPGTEEGDIVPVEAGTEEGETVDGGADEGDSETVSGEVPPEADGAVAEAGAAGVVAAVAALLAAPFLL